MSESKKKDFSQEIADIERQFEMARADNGGDDIMRKRVVQNSVVLTEKIRKAKSYDELIKFLRWKRSRGIIDKKESFELNEYESEKLDTVCECHNKTVAGLHAEVGGQYKFTKYFDESRQCDMYITYITQVIEPEAQMSRELARKIQQGFHPQPEDYAPERIIYHRFPLRESEWKRHFRTIE